jgi:hypothetical protein
MQTRLHARLLPVLILAGCGGSQPRPEDPAPPELPPGEAVEPEPELAPEPAPEPVEEPAVEEAPATVPEQGGAAMAQTEAEIPLEGTIASRKGRIVAIDIDHPDPPAKDSTGVLYKFFDKQLGPFSASGWLGIANVTVTASSQSSLKLRIDEELSVMKVNGKKVNHFVKGTAVKMEIGP